MAADLRTGLIFAIALFFSLAPRLAAPLAVHAGLPGTIAKIKPSIVGVGTYMPSAKPSARLRGTGFVVADGRHVITNAHVVPRLVNAGFREVLTVFTGIGDKTTGARATIVVMDELHDLALLQITGTRLPALSLGNSSQVREGDAVALTGYPLGPVLGLWPVTHQGIVSSITPLLTPLKADGRHTAAMMDTLRAPFMLFQLDATAYPGNSGSPVFLRDSGQVVGVINKVIVEGAKENALTNPSGISYAVPAYHVKELLRKAGIATR